MAKLLLETGDALLLETGDALLLESGTPTTLPSVLFKTDTGTDDDGTTFQAYVTTPAVQLTLLGKLSYPREPYLAAKAASGVSIQVTTRRDFGLQAQAAPTVSLTPEGSETHVIRRIDGIAVADASILQFTIGDAAAISNGWVLDRFEVPTVEEGER